MAVFKAGSGRSHLDDAIDEACRLRRFRGRTPRAIEIADELDAPLDDVIATLVRRAARAEPLATTTA
jgi:hypothetical protein